MTCCLSSHRVVSQEATTSTPGTGSWATRSPCVRLVGFEPKNPVLMYNLGCNGVGFLQSIFGGHRVSALHGGNDLGRSIFDPS